MVMNNSVLDGPTVFAFPQYAEPSSTEPEGNGLLFTRSTNSSLDLTNQNTAFTRRYLVRCLGHQLLHWNQVRRTKRCSSQSGVRVEFHTLKQSPKLTYTPWKQSHRSRNRSQPIRADIR